MEIRLATEGDLSTILALGYEFGHLMFYQKSEELLRPHLSNILVVEDNEFGVTTLEGYYHYLPIEEHLGKCLEILRCYKQFPDYLIEEALEKEDKIAILMQGASHREVFTEFIKYLQERYSELWCWCSIKSKRPDTYRQLGFTFDYKEERTFWNVHKGDYSTYQLGRWEKEEV